MNGHEFFLLGFRIRRVKAHPQFQEPQVCWRVSRGGTLVDSFLSKKRAVQEVKRMGLLS